MVLDARKRQLEQMTRIELLDIAKTYGIKGRHSMTKDRLIEAAMKHDDRAQTEKDAVKAQPAAREPEKPRDIPDEQEPQVGIQKVEDEQTEAEQAKYILGAIPPLEEFPLPAELPESYGRDTLTLLVRDPHWAYAYWEITDSTIERVRNELGDQFNSGSRVLRIHDLSNGQSERYFDIEIDEWARNWYINVGKPGGRFCAEFGLRTQNGDFRAILRSNDISMPPVGMSEIIDEHWMSLREEFERMYALSGGFQPGTSSAEMVEQFEKRLKEQVSSGAMFSMMSPVYKNKEHGFWFKVDTELIVYGATEPDATVTVQGKPIRLRPDGSFTLRFSLPDGKQTIDITAKSADNVEERTITPEVEKRTHEPEPVLNE